MFNIYFSFPDFRVCLNIPIDWSRYTKRPMYFFLLVIDSTFTLSEMMNSRIISIIAVIGMISVCSIKADGLYDNYLGNVHPVPLAYPVPHPISAPPQGLGGVAGNPLDLQSGQSLLSKYV